MGQSNIIGNYNFGHTFDVQPYKFGHHETFFFCNLLFSTFRIIFTSRAFLNYSLIFLKKIIFTIIFCQDLHNHKTLK